VENAFADVAVTLVKVETLPTVGGHVRHTACCRPVPSQYPGPNAGCTEGTFGSIVEDGAAKT